MRVRVVKTFLVRILGRVMKNTLELEFIDNGNAPDFFCNGLQSVLVMGSVTRFIHYVIRSTPGGVLYRETCFTCIMPNEAIAPAVTLALTSTGQSVEAPSARDLMLPN